MADADGASRQIMLPIDDSPNCRRAFNWYKTQMKKAGDKVLFLHVIETQCKAPPIEIVMENEPVLPEDIASLVNQNIEDGKALGREYLCLAREANIECNALVCMDTRVGQSIIKSAEDNQCDTIVIGSRGLGTIKRTFLGSVSDHIIHHSHIPVVVVPPEHET